MKVLGTIFFILFLLATASSQALALTLGPYKGRVVDAKDNTPVAGASVLIYWTKHVPQMPHGRREVIRASLIYTTEDGTYSIPRFRANLGLMGRYESINVVAYEPGYKAHILKVEFLNPYKKPDPSFREDGYVVKLKRLPPIFDHKEHFKKIEDALENLRGWYFPFDPPTGKTDEWVVKDKLEAGYLVREELLRRVEWEERRWMDEEYRK
jgi:hypothetical protein